MNWLLPALVRPLFPIGGPYKVEAYDAISLQMPR